MKPQDFQSMLGHFLTCMKGLTNGRMKILQAFILKN